MMHKRLNGVLALIFLLLSTSPVYADTYTITYQDVGFLPAAVVIKAGDTVKFVNRAMAPLDLASDPHPTHEIFPTLNIGRVDYDGAVVTFLEVGKYGYHNHLNPLHQGIITVGDPFLVPTPTPSPVPTPPPSPTPLLNLAPTLAVLPTLLAPPPSMLPPMMVIIIPSVIFFAVILLLVILIANRLRQKNNYRRLVHSSQVKMPALKPLNHQLHTENSEVVDEELQKAKSSLDNWLDDITRRRQS